MSEVRYNVIAPTGVTMGVTGNLGKDPTINDVNGTRVIKFSLAAKAPDKKVDGVWQKNQTQWISINIWENAPGADKVFALLEPEHEWMKLKKGAHFHIEGYVHQETRIYEGKEYVDHTFKEVFVFNKPPMQAKKQDGDNSASGETLPTPAATDNF